jgi:O-acetyl-ADP-ribose deacetylase (regulator of RNase III)
MHVRIAPADITELAEHEVFVFGSNRAGRHTKGAALLAHRKFGARMGQADGLMGRSYGIPTKDRNLRTLPLPAIGSQVAKFLRFAVANPQHVFLVTQIGCGLAGYQPRDIAPLFTAHPILDNVALPEAFAKLLKRPPG